MEMRKCKECGKMFTPRGREQYCSDIHYRPCPVCGKPVVAKYLSDPARRCEDCKRGARPVVKPTVEPSSAVNKQLIEETVAEITPDASDTIAATLVESSPVKKISPISYFEDVREYIGTGKSTKFIPHHQYSITIGRDEYAYLITSTYDVTDDKEVFINDVYSSQISINQNFRKAE